MLDYYCIIGVTPVLWVIYKKSYCELHSINECIWEQPLLPGYRPNVVCSDDEYF